MVAGAAGTASQVTPTSLRGRWHTGIVSPHTYNTAMVRAPKSAPAPIRLAPAVTSHMGIRAHGFRLMDFPGTPVSVASASGSDPSSTMPGFRSFSPLSASSFNGMAMQNHRRLEVVVDWDAVRKTTPKRLLKAFFADPDSPDAVSIGYVTYTASH